MPASGVVSTRNERQSDIGVEAKRACEFNGVHAGADGPNRNRRNVERDTGLRHDAEASGASLGLGRSVADEGAVDVDVMSDAG